MDFKCAEYRSIIFIFSLFLLFSCTPRMPPGQSAYDVARCKLLCKTRAELCQKTCRNNCLQCNDYACMKTAQRYRQYVHEQCIKGEKPIRRLNSYRDPLQCRKTTCNCVADYQVCMQSCSGTIHKQLLVPPVC